MNTRAKRPAPTTLGERIEHARRHVYDISQAQLGDMLEVSRAAVSQYEQDKIRPRTEVIDRLAEVFNAAPEWFSHGRGRAPKLDDVPVTIPEIDVALISSSTIDDLRRLWMGRTLSLPMGWLRGPVARNKMVAFTAPNDALPQVRAGDPVVVDLECHTIEPRAVFLVHAAGDERSARLHVGDPGDATILGRVVACFLRVD